MPTCSNDIPVLWPPPGHHWHGHLCSPAAFLCFNPADWRAMGRAVGRGGVEWGGVGRGGFFPKEDHVTNGHVE